jgi:hypothetical protein
MTEEQRISMIGDIAAIQVLLFTLMKASPNRKTIRTAFLLQKDLHSTALLHSGMSEKEIQVTHERLSIMERALWG